MVVAGCYTLGEKKLVATTIAIGVGYAGYQDGVSISSKMLVATNLNSFISKEVERLYKEKVDKNRMIRRIGFAFGGLLPQSYEQYDLFTNLADVEKEKRLRDSIIAIHEKFGKNSLLKAMDLGENSTAILRNKQIGGHNSED